MQASASLAALSIALVTFPIAAAGVTILPPDAPLPYVPVSTCPEEGPVVVYEHPGYAGACRSFEEGDYPFLPATFPGGQAMDDAISSVRVRPGYLAMLFHDPSFEGPRRAVEGEAPFVFEQHDRVSSLRVFRTAVPLRLDCPAPDVHGSLVVWCIESQSPMRTWYVSSFVWTPEYRIRAHVDRYSIGLPTGGSLIVNCLAARVNQSDVEPCRDLGWQFEERLLTLVDEPLVWPGPPQVAIRVCEATLSAMGAGIGFEDLPIAVTC